MMSKPRMVFTKKIADEVCARLVEGSSLAEICRDPKMPKTRTVFQWLSKDDDFARDYARAREAQGDTDADKIGDIANQVVLGQLDPAAARVAIDAYKWTAGRRKPKSYGDRLAIEGSGPNGEHLITRIVIEAADGNGKD